MIGYSKFQQVGKPKEKSKQKPIPAGPKGEEWNNVRKTIKKQFESWGITSCELQLDGCTGSEFLSFAHVDKRKNLLPGELNKVVLACVHCHTIVEQMPSKEMRKLLETKIADREAFL